MMAQTPSHSRTAANVQWLWVSIIVIGVDQVVKQLAVNHLTLFQPLPVTGWLNIMLLHNTGAAFSMLSWAPRWTFVVLAAAVALGILIWLWRHPYNYRLCAASMALIAGGALSNAIDRATRGYVIDFIDFHIGNWHWPAFNIADSAIVIGAVLIAIDAFRPRRAPEKTAGK